MPEAKLKIRSYSEKDVSKKNLIKNKIVEKKKSGTKKITSAPSRIHRKVSTLDKQLKAKESFIPIIKLLKAEGKYKSKIRTIEELVDFYQILLPILNSNRFLGLEVFKDPGSVIKSFGIELEGEVRKHFDVLPIKRKSVRKIGSSKPKTDSKATPVTSVRFLLNDWLKKRATGKLKRELKVKLPLDIFKSYEESFDELVSQKSSNEISLYSNHGNLSWDYVLQFEDKFFTQVLRLLFMHVHPFLANTDVHENHPTIGQIQAFHSTMTSIEIGAIFPFEMKSNVNSIEMFVDQTTDDVVGLKGRISGSMKSLLGSSPEVTFDHEFYKKGSFILANSFNTLGATGDIFETVLWLRSTSEVPSPQDPNDAEEAERIKEIKIQHYLQDRDQFNVLHAALLNGNVSEVVIPEWDPTRDILLKSLLEQAVNRFFKTRFPFIPFFAGPFKRAGIEEIDLFPQTTDVYTVKNGARGGVNLALAKTRNTVNRDRTFKVKPGCNGMIGVSDQQFMLHFFREVPNRPINIDDKTRIEEIQAMLVSGGIRVEGKALYDLCECFPTLEIDFELMLNAAFDEDGNLGIILIDYNYDGDLWLDITKLIFPVIGPIILDMVERRVYGQVIEAINRENKASVFSDLLGFFNKEIGGIIHSYSEFKELEVDNNGIYAHGNFSVFNFRPVVATLFERKIDATNVGGRRRRVLAESLEEMLELVDNDRLPMSRKEFKVSLSPSATFNPSTSPSIWGGRLINSTGEMTRNLNGFEVIRVFRDTPRGSNFSIEYINHMSGERIKKDYTFPVNSPFSDLDIDIEAGFTPTELRLTY